MSDSEPIELSEDSKQSNLDHKLKDKVQRYISEELKIPAVSQIQITEIFGGDASKSKNKFKQELDKEVENAMKIIDSIKQEDFSKDPDFLKLQIEAVEEKLDQVSKALWVKLELTDNEEPPDYFSMIKSAKAVFNRDLKDLLEKEKAFNSQEFSEEVNELYINKINLEEKLVDLKDKWNDCKGNIVKELIEIGKLIYINL